MRGSSLVDKIIPAHVNNYNNQRFGNPIKKITLHHVAGVVTIESLGSIWQNPNREGSSHYGIGNDGRIAQYVDEDHTAWTDSNRTSNRTSITIEVSNSATGGEWPVSDLALNSLIKLVADIAKRNNLGKLVRGQNFTWHKMYYNTACPGPYLMSKIDYIIEEANKINYPSYPFAIGTTIYPKEDIFLYSNAGYGNATTWRIAKGTECQVALYHTTNGLYMALKDRTGTYFPSAWTNEFDKFTTEKPIIEPTPIEEETILPIPEVPTEPENNPIEENLPEDEQIVEEEEKTSQNEENKTTEANTNIFVIIFRIIIKFIQEIFGGRK